MNSLVSIENQTLALGGIFQSVHLCKTLATSGTCEQDELDGTLRSIMTLKTDKAIDAYGGNTSSIGRGLRILKSQLGGNAESRVIDVARYSLALIQLGTNALNDANSVEQLRIGISRAQAMEKPATHPDIISNLANLYRSSISHLSPRIMVSGDPEHLNNNEIASTIRAALLGGIRSVVLWRQCGGSRPKLLLSRSQYIRQADQYLQS
jgi:high frequency lysogenization protein